MCGLGQLFFFQCGADMLKGWTLLNHDTSSYHNSGIFISLASIHFLLVFIFFCLHTSSEYQNRLESTEMHHWMKSYLLTNWIIYCIQVDYVAYIMYFAGNNVLPYIRCTHVFVPNFQEKNL